MAQTQNNPSQKTATQVTRLEFPKNTGMEFFKLVFRKFALSNQGAGKSAGNGFTTKAEAEIILPIPTAINEAVNVSYNDTELGVVKSLSNIGRTMSNQNWKEDPIDSIVNSAKTAGATAFEGGLRATGENSVGVEVEQQVAKIANPHIALAFRGIPFRTHSFTWRLFPESVEESDVLTRMINVLKYYMLPDVNFNSGILSYPHESILTIEGVDPVSVPLYKRGVVQDVNVNYTAGGVPVFFQNTNRPALIELTLTYKEIEILTKSDFQAAIKQ